MNIPSRITLFLFAFIIFIYPAQANPVRIFHGGDIDGIASSYRYQLNTSYQLVADFASQNTDKSLIRDFSIQKTAIYFYSNQHYLFGKNFGIRELRAFLNQPPIPIAQEKVYLLTSNGSLLTANSASNPLIQNLAQYASNKSKYQSKLRLEEAELVSYPDDVQVLRLPRTKELSRNALDWEMLLGFEMQVKNDQNLSYEMQIIGKPQGEGTRRMQLIQSMRQANDLLVDSGNIVEGLSSVLTNSLSMQRNNSLNMAQTLDYFAINVSKGELRGGLGNLLREQETYQLPLISASIKHKGNYVFPPYKELMIGNKKAALIGITDNIPLKRLQELGDLDPDLEILSPEEAIEQILLQIKTSHQADIIVLLANLEASKLRYLVDNGNHLHLILGNTDTPLQHLKESIEMNQLEDPHPFLAYTNKYGINLLELKTQHNSLSISNEMIPVYFDLEPNTDYLQKILNIRQKAYEDALDPLIPNLGPAIQKDPELLEIFLNSKAARQAAEQIDSLQPVSQEKLLEAFPPFMTSEMLMNLEMNALMEGFGAEIVIFKSSKTMELNIPGALPRLLVYERLKMGDTLEMYYLNGTQLKAILAVPNAELIFGGLSADHKKVWGRPLGDRKTVYKVLMPSGVSSLEGIRDLLAKSRSQKDIVNPFITQAKGEPIYLRNTLISFLEKLEKSPNQIEQLTHLMKPHWNQKQLLFSLELENLQLNLSGYNALNKDHYAEVRETRVISPSSFTFGGKSGLGFGLDHQYFGFKNGIFAKYEGLSVLDDNTSQKRFTENQDDLYFSSELEMRFFSFPLADSQISLVPFVEAIYDTEFTPTLNTESNLDNPLQSELRGVLGLSIPAGPILKKFKTGLALRRDFNVPDNLEAGLDFKFVHEYPINASLKWNNDLDLRYFFPTAKDNASSLGLIAQWVSSLNVSLTENLVLRFFADSYVFQGKRPETSQIGASVILGVGLGYDRIWKPFYEPLF